MSQTDEKSGNRRRGAPSASYSFTVRLKITKQEGRGLSKVINAIADAGGDAGDINTPRVEDKFVVRDILIYASDQDHAELIEKQIRALDHVEVVSVSDMTFKMHLGGKIIVTPRVPINGKRDVLSMVYTPGVARVCKAIHEDPSKAHALTMKGNSVAVVTDGSRILALGNIGPLAGLPVMEGKAALFSEFGKITAVPIPLATQDPDEIIKVIKAIAPAFGAINLEDIASPGCYHIEDTLRTELDIPVIHDDQHATAIAVMAGTINAAKVAGKRLRDMKIVVCGVGAAGMACCKMLLQAGVRNLIGFNVNGAVFKGAPNLTVQEQWLADNSNKRGFKGTMEEALQGADMFLGLSVAGALKPEWIKGMKDKAIIFALANPKAEVDPEEAEKCDNVAVIATGSSAYCNQVNNALVFPGMFRGALDARLTDMTDEVKMALAKALAGVVTRAQLHSEYILPDAFDARAHKAVADAVVTAANKLGLSRRSDRKSSTL
jgi:malate dehydrogenase (oxaloacetate-decarboxylating)